MNCSLVLLATLAALLAPCTAAHSQEPFQDMNKTCTMKLTQLEVEEGKPGRFMVGIICEKRKVLSYWECPEVDGEGLTPYTCIEKETQYVDPVHGAQRESRGREMRIYAPSKERVPYVLCGRLCDPTR